jgi:hypothetical protein
MKWTTAATAPNQLVAEMWVELLRNEGVPAMLHPQDVRSYLGLTNSTCRVQVPEEQLERAQELIGETEDERI